jgi:hypothetical protein
LELFIELDIIKIPEEPITMITVCFVIENPNSRLFQRYILKMAVIRKVSDFEIGFLSDVFSKRSAMNPQKNPKNIKSAYSFE